MREDGVGRGTRSGRAMKEVSLPASLDLSFSGRRQDNGSCGRGGCVAGQNSSVVKCARVWQWMVVRACPDVDFCGPANGFVLPGGTRAAKPAHHAADTYASTSKRGHFQFKDAYAAFCIRF